jgi:hypothetical protein
MVEAPGGQEHLARAKERALGWGGRECLIDAWSSLMSDLRAHPETACHEGIERGIGLLMGGHLSHAEAMREFVESLA